MTCSWFYDDFIIKERYDSLDFVLLIIISHLEFLFSLQVAASVAFLIARYFAREQILKLVKGDKKFYAIDKAIGENGFRVVTLLRLSPLLPFSLGNYLYGLTSVKFVPYVLGRSDPLYNCNNCIPFFSYLCLYLFIPMCMEHFNLKVKKGITYSRVNV